MSVLISVKILYWSKSIIRNQSLTVNKLKVCYMFSMKWFISMVFHFKGNFESFYKFRQWGNKMFWWIVSLYTDLNENYKNTEHKKVFSYWFLDKYCLIHTCIGVELANPPCKIGVEKCSWNVVILPSIPGLVKSKRLHNSVRLFCIGLPVNKILCGVLMCLTAIEIFAVGFRILWPSSRIR